MQKTKIGNPDKTVRLLFEDEASFGRISLVQQQVQTLRSQPSHKGVQVCFWCSGTFNGGKIFFSYAKLQYQ